ncbi:gamma-aminobutyric acid receptor alpha-like isoform X1 [Haliotis rufescens]|uniref:gamma-aminobutyric acid receptor alpha-like isoform X1 n=1 Tax=Haliotis rufescens TaxID=6454 RepID=UPI00201EF4F4|nr:gamma-aminobutyric acid receptor alpha-like isoform X1 [Haliotis rufescens]
MDGLLRHLTLAMARRHGAIVTYFVLSALPLSMSLAEVKMYNASQLLENMLVGYDKRLRPGFGGKPLAVMIYINLRSMGPISELDMVYTLDCYFRQTWYDKRLSMNISLEHLPLGITILERIWHPDTVFYNGQNSYLHTITTPNKFVRISPNGNVLYSQRLTIRASCVMDLKTFPLDIQSCPLFFGSFAYSTEDVVYQWRYGKDGKSVEFGKDIWLSQFDLIGSPLSNYTGNIKGAPHTILKVKFHLYRHAGYFIIQVYVPCALLVILSWVAFWINREATADRIALGTTTVLTMTICGIENKTDFPKISYITALDMYVAVCFAFVLATILEFAFVHYFTKYGTGEPLLYDSSEDEEDSVFEETFEEEQECPDLESNGLDGSHMPKPAKGGNFGRILLAKVCDCLHCITHTKVYYGFKKKDMTGFINSVSQIDKSSRVLFPVTFLIFNVVYWVSYSRWKV